MKTKYFDAHQKKISKHPRTSRMIFFEIASSETNESTHMQLCKIAHHLHHTGLIDGGSSP
jgi:hypothetical protein